MSEGKGIPIEVWPGPGWENARRFTRIQMRAHVLWDDRSREGWQGEVRDISRAGLFLTSMWGLPEYLLVGDVVAGQLQLDGVERTFSAVVRWRGYSERHEAFGIGVELQDPSQLTDEELKKLTGDVRRD